MKDIKTINNFLSDSINNKIKSDTLIKSLLWNSIVEVFDKKKSIDIKEDLKSIQINWDTFFISTWEPIVNREIFLLEKDIKDLFENKINKIGIKVKYYHIRYK